MANCKLADRIEKRTLLSDEVPLLRNGKDNNTIIYDLPPLTEDEKNIFPELPFPTPPPPSSPPRNGTMEKHQL